MTPQDIIQDVRDIIQDTDATNYRYADTVLLRFVNQTIKRMVPIRPDLFIRHEVIPTTPNITEQTIPASYNSYRLVDIFRVLNGKALEEVDRLMFNRMDANWTLDPPGVPTKFMRHPKNPNRYFLYPRPEPDTALVVEYVSAPADRQLTERIKVGEYVGGDMSTAYWSALVDGTVFLAESVDDEFVNNQRAKMFYDSFIAGLSIGVQSRALVDLDDATIPTQG